MFRQSRQQIWTLGGVSLMLHSMISTASTPKIFQNLYVQLWTAGPSPLSPQMTIGDFTEAGFSGYNQVFVTPSPAVLNYPSGQGQGLMVNALFEADGGIVSPGETVLGYWIRDHYGFLDLAEQFSEPVTFLNAGDFLELQVFLGFPFSQQIE